MAEPLTPSRAPDQPTRQQEAPASEQAPDKVQLSTTGAVLGKPGAEHSMYGMVREDTPDAQALDEREIRGVEPPAPVEPAAPAAPAPRP
jgi:hypothetical protein